MINLYDLNINACAKIISINNNDTGKIRLLEMGLMPSTEARIIKKALVDRFKLKLIIII